MHYDENNRKTLYFNLDGEDLQSGEYNIIENYSDSNKDVVHYDKFIWIYHNYIKINPTNITYYTDIERPQFVILNFTEVPILKSQIFLLELTDSNNKITTTLTPNNYILTTSSIQIFYAENMIDFTKAGTYRVTITEINGAQIIFSITVEERKSFEEANFIITFPKLGFENTTNIITINSEEYDVSRLTKIIFNVSHCNDNENYKNTYIINRNTIIESYDSQTCSLKIPLYLRHNLFYTLQSIQYKQKSKDMTENLTLQGFFLESPFYLINSQTQHFTYDINFYNTYGLNQLENGYIYENNEPDSCIPSIYMYECTYDKIEPHIPQTVNITIEENQSDLAKMLQLYLITYSTNQTCFVMRNQTFDVTLNFTLANDIGTVRGIFDDEVFNGESVKYGLYYHHLVTYTISVMNSQKIDLDFYVEFQKFNEYYRYPIPDLGLKVIDYLKLESVDYNNTSSILKLTFNRNLKEGDIKKVILRNTKSNSEQDISNKCLISNENNNDNTKNFYLCEHNINDEFYYFVDVYDVCGNQIESSSNFIIPETFKLNTLNYFNPKAIKSSEKSKTITLTYQNDITEDFKHIKLINNETKEFCQINRTNFSNINGKTLTFSASKLNNNCTRGLFTIATGFSKLEVLSESQILLYENEIEFNLTSKTFLYNSTIENIAIPLKYPIIKEQIAKISLIKSDGSKNTKSFTWNLISSNQIEIHFNSKLTIDDVYELKLNCSKNNADFLIFEINFILNIEFYFNREFVDMGNDQSFELDILPFCNETNICENITDITSSREELNFSKETGEFTYSDIEHKFNHKFTTTYDKRNIALPEEIEFSFYLQGVSKPIKINNTVKITDSESPFFYLSSTEKTIYKGSDSRITLYNAQSFSEINFSNFKAYLRYNNTKRTFLNQNQTNLNIFYLDNSTLKNYFEDLTAELVIYEKNNTEYISFQGFYITFSKNTQPTLEVGKCNGGLFLGGNCKCPKNYYGKFCSYTKEHAIDFTGHFASFLNGTDNINLTNQTLHNELLEFTTIISQDNSINIDLLSISNNPIYDDIQGLGGSTHIEVEAMFYLTSIVIADLQTKMHLRRLSQDDKKIKERIEKLFEQLRTVTLDVTFEEKNGCLAYELPIQHIFYYKINQEQKAINQYLQLMNETNRTFVQLDKVNNTQNGFYFLLVNNKDLSKNNLSIQMEFHPQQQQKRLLKQSEQTNKNEVTIYFSINEFNENIFTNKVNLTLFQEYAKKNINILLQEDPIFDDKCYSTDSKLFDYDLTQQYRKTNLYQNHSLIIDGSSCKYKGVNEEGTYIIYTCEIEQLEQQQFTYLEFKEVPLNKKHSQVESFLPLKCLNSILHLPTNIALWLFTLLTLILIGGFIFLLLKKPPVSSTKEAVPVAIDSNRTIQNNTTEEVTLEKVNISIQKEKEQIKEEYSLCKKYLENLKQLHPITSIYYSQYILLICKLPILISSISSVIGFNALYYKESDIEKRIYKSSNRNSFVYPICYNLDIMMASIATTVLYTVCVKLVILKAEIKEMIGKIRMIGCIVVCLFIITFFWVYCVGFCGIYQNTQLNWLYLGIWGLIFNCVILAPVSVLVVTLIDKFVKELHILRELFWV